jgi:hypothetical protein
MTHGENGMSTQGSGIAALAAPIGIGVGVGILIGHGIVLCGKQLERICEKAAQEHAEAVDAEHRYSLAQSTPMKSLFATRVVLAVAKQEEPQMAETTLPFSDLQETIRQIIARTHALLNNVHTPLPSVQEMEREYLRLPLTEEAYQQVETPQSRLACQQREVQHSLRLVKAQLRALNEMLSQVESTEEPGFIERQHTLMALLDSAQSQLDTNLASAQQLVEEAQRVAHIFTGDVTAFLFDAWAEIGSQVSRQMGMLNTLKRMLTDAQNMKMEQYEHTNELMQSILSASNEAEAIRQSSSLRVAHRLSLLATRTAFLKEDVFALIGKYQQQTIAETIATTLSELGFQAADSAIPTVQTNGAMMHITAMRTEEKAEGLSNDRLITFDVSRDGNVAYDFSGYSDESCVKEAERIFSALRLAGLYLFDTQLVDHLLAAYPEGISKRTLDRLHCQLQPVANKLQMELAKRIQSVLEQMHYMHIQQSSVGGCIELDAFNGSLGYHVVLAPEGALQVFRDAEQIDVSTDPSDPLVAEAQQVVKEREEQETKEDNLDESVQKWEKNRGQQKKRLLEN